MRQYVFDDAGLRDILDTAYKHGYADSLYEASCYRETKNICDMFKKQQHLDDYLAGRGVPFGQVVDGTPAALRLNEDGSLTKIWY